MTLINLAIENWSDVLVIVIILVSLIGALIKWMSPLFSDKMTNKEKIAHVTRLLTNIVPIAVLYVTQAELGFGDGTGVIKRSFVIAKLYALIPDQYRSLVTEENLDAVLERALIIARQLWDEKNGVENVQASDGLLTSI